MKRKIFILENESGFVLVATLLFMVLLTIIGIAINRNTTTELQIAGNDRTHKETFYKADGGTELAQEMVEQNVACLSFASNYSGGRARLSGYDDTFDVIVQNGELGFWRNFSPVSPPTDNDNIFYFSFDDSQGATYFNLGGSTKLTTGAAIQMAAGYEGKGKGIGSGGVSLVYDIYSRHYGKNNSESLIYVEYTHVLGSEGDCYF